LTNRYSLVKKKVLITGASRGIGRAIALTFASNGADLILIARNQNGLQTLLDEVQELNKNANCELICSDVRDTEAIISGIETICENAAPPDILVNNAGTFMLDSVRNKNRQVWDDTVSTYLTAAYELSCYVSKFMIDKNWGRIVNISSISADGEKYALSYSTAKAGLIGFTRALALELAKFRITVNAICPAWVATDMAINQLQDAHWCKLHNIDPEQSIDIARLSMPQERLLDAEEIAHMTAYLCSQEARGITGQSINICGGLSLV
jgi:NAD(P)-dependent dehydrogenase (short-subunit alcohol dehydrogenase family)